MGGIALKSSSFHLMYLSYTNGFKKPECSLTSKKIKIFNLKKRK